jgi:predicted MFS family arabinose efflux permease
MVAIVQLAIALGATVGGLVFDVSGYQATFELSAALLVLAAALAYLAARSAAHTAPVTGHANA